MTPFTNPLPYVFILATAFGVLMHDTKVDQAASVAIVAPSSFTDFAVADAAARTNEHVHVERVSISNQGGSTQPRNDDRRYVQSKKFAMTGGDSIGLWPSN